MATARRSKKKILCSRLYRPLTEICRKSDPFAITTLHREQENRQANTKFSYGQTWQRMCCAASSPFLSSSFARSFEGPWVLTTRAYSLSSNDRPRPHRVRHCDLITVVIASSRSPLFIHTCVGEGRVRHLAHYRELILPPGVMSLVSYFGWFANDERGQRSKWRTSYYVKISWILGSTWGGWNDQVPISCWFRF